MHFHFSFLAIFLASVANAVVPDDLRLAAARCIGPRHPYGFRVVDVLGDGNCFLYSCMHGMGLPAPITGQPLTAEMRAAIKEYKRQLLELMRVSDP